MNHGGSADPRRGSSDAVEDRAETTDAVQVLAGPDAATDPVACAVIEALRRRAASQQGEASQWMLRRVEVLLAQQAAANALAVRVEAAADERVARRQALAGLSSLVDRLDRSPRSATPAWTPPQSGAAQDGETFASAARSHTAPPSPLKSVDAFKGTWSRLRADQRLRQALAQVPARAGPMNSSHVMNRALQAMCELSPAYFDAFLVHVDTLLHLEQSSGAAGLTPRPAAATDSSRRRTRPAAPNRRS